MVHVRGIVWVGTRTAQFGSMTSFVAEVLGLVPLVDTPGFAAFGFDDGSHFDIFGPDDQENVFMRGPVAGFLVDDVAQARTEMETNGVPFIGQIHRLPDGNEWSQFFAPDGHVYEITNRPDLPRPE